MKLISNSWRVCSLGVALLVVLALPQLASGVVPVVKTVPWDPSNPAATHTSYPGATIHLKGTSSVQGATIQADWNLGDGSPHAIFTVTNMWDVSTTHGYVGAVGTAWTAILTITDTSTGENDSANYLIQQCAHAGSSGPFPSRRMGVRCGLARVYLRERRRIQLL